MVNLPKGPRLISKNTNDGQDEAKSKVVSKKHLTNKLNFINFQDGTILVNLKHARYGRTLSLQAKPQPCLGDRVDCLWAEPSPLSQELTSFQFENVLIADGREALLVQPEEITLNETQISFQLPETCKKISTRRIRRYPCVGIKVRLTQNSAVFYGTLSNFNSAYFQVEINAIPPQTFQWINPDFPVILTFLKKGKTLYSSDCRIIRHSDGFKKRTYVLEPLNQHIHRFKPKQFRRTRQVLLPSPNVNFLHPLTNTIFDLNVIDISGSGFSVEEDGANAVLLPGMIFSDLELNFANSFKVKCQAQVIYRNSCPTDEAPDKFKCGLAILDMNIHDHVRLLAILYQANDRNSYLCNKVDMEALWHFFFATGFIYPEKYTHIQVNKEKLKETYEKLYTRNPSIARHFLYQENGTILGHMAILRFYDNSWLFHHHAATRSSSQKAGLMVLNQVGRFINDSHALRSMNMNYVMCYFRPQNKFPYKVFGGIARSINDPKACSLDNFAYLHFRRDQNAKWYESGSWVLSKVEEEDLLDLEGFYRNNSDGLMLRAFGLNSCFLGKTGLEEEYSKIDLERGIHLFSLKKNGKIKAIIMYDVANIGLNMSELTNCIKVFILDTVEMSSDILNLTLSSLLSKFKKEQIPVLIYPEYCAEKLSLKFDKIYELWVLNVDYLDSYFKYLKRLIKTIQH